MKFTRHANATWQGTGMEGKGTVSTQSKTLDHAQLSYRSRFENGIGTNPEELVAAAHSGCFSMKLAFVLSELGHPADQIETTAKVTLDSGKITHIGLELHAKVPGISNEAFQKAAQNAKENCPISQLLNAEITLDAKLLS
ncbi:MAG: OsmC family protein [Sphingobacteriaceae bacterium]|jgi:osmotically inducible protein OsmC|nr:MAG: OsmC family peroxiredoxin [Pedobacter sp.]